MCKVDCPDSNMVKTGINIDHEELPIGCQHYGLNKDVDFFEDCCFMHSQCYHSCGKDKRKCDILLDKCTSRTCQNVSKKDHFMCKEIKKLISLSISSAGCFPYERAQEKVCLCDDKPMVDHFYPSEKKKPQEL